MASFLAEYVIFSYPIRFVKRNWHFSHASPEPEVRSLQTVEVAGRSLLLTAVVAGRILPEHCRTLAR